MATNAPRTLSATSAALLDPVRKLQDGGFEGEFVFVDFEEQGREQVEIWHRGSSLMRSA